MARSEPLAHENWSSRLAFIFAAVGSAVGLGNIWKFPYEAGQGGGGAFVLIYLAFVFGIGVPVMIAELTLGRRGHLSPPNAVKKVAREEGRSTLWAVAGWSGVVGALLVLSFYSVIAGLTLSYMVASFTGSLTILNQYTSGDYFGAVTGNFWIVLLWHGIFMAITITVVARGIHGGLEKAVTWLMPALFGLLLLLVIYALSVGDAASAIRFLFQPDFSKVTFETVIQALGQAFFSLSLALGAIMAYGAYVPKDVSLPKSAFIIADSRRSGHFPHRFSIWLGTRSGGGACVHHFARGFCPDARRYLCGRGLFPAFGHRRPDLGHFPSRTLCGMA
jgi:NSS family neurotransmitter:Na+ symporter